MVWFLLFPFTAPTMDATGIDIDCIAGMNMPISPHQISNVLRVYGDQLCQSGIFDPPEGTDVREPERISISAKTRRKTIIDNITSNIIKRITQSERHGKLETEILKGLESEHQKPAFIHENHRHQLIFKQVDENTETLNSLSIENSKFLISILRVIRKKPGKNVR